MALKFDSLRYTVKTNASGKPRGPLDKFKGSLLDKDLLLNVSGSVQPGSVLAILGPSGAGKTTLLNMLTLERKGGVPQGRIRVGDSPFTLNTYNKTAAFVEQFDTLWASLTVRDHLATAIRLYQPLLQGDEREKAIDDLIRSIGLVDQQDVKAGNEFSRGLSGGNKRRLSIGIALAKKPSVLFLDEPTSGVDSASAVWIMSFLKDIAKARSIVVVCTIHQPPASVFAGFDNCMILSMGRVAYFGRAAAMGEYFTSIGKTPPKDTNLAEFVLELVNKDFTSASGVVALLDKWREHGDTPYGIDNGLPERSTHVDVEVRAGLCTQMMVLVKRELTVARREPLAYLLRMVANFSLAIFFGVIYVETRNRRQDQIQSRTFFILFAMGVPMQLVLVSVYQYYQQWISLKKEVKDGMYHPMAAAAASWVVQAPMQFVLAACSMVPIFVLGDMYWPNFLMAWLVYSITFWAFEGLAQMLSVSPKVILGFFNYLNLYFAAFLFCGMFVDVDDVIWPLRALCYFLPLGWALQSYVHAIYHGQPDYEGVMDCVPGQLTPTGSVCGDQGFYCYTESDPTGAVCYGRTGDQILTSLSIQFTIYGPDGHYARNLILILAFGIACRLGYVMQVVWRTKFVGSEEPREPSAATAGLPGTPPAAAEADNVRTGASAVVAPDAGAEEAQEAADSLALPSTLASRGDCVYAFSNIRYEITPRSRLGSPSGPPKLVMAGASATVRSGEVLAILGPSGAGKTILLDTLNFSKGPGAPSGKVSINGTTISRSMHPKACIYVPREDILWASLTPRQHLSFAHKLYQPQLSAVEREKAIDSLLTSTGMTSAQHTKAGGVLFQGLSGGQRRRLSLCMALVKQPRVIILDEPTSGLDSAAAAAIVSLLREIASKASAAIVCTIHQPSAAVFAGFHQALVLAEGRVAYCGDRAEMSPYFASINKPLVAPDGGAANPAEAILDLVSKDITSKEEVSSVLDAWETSAKNSSLHGNAGETAARPFEAGENSIGILAETSVVLRRQMYLAVNDPLQYIVRMIVCPFVCAFFGVVYIESRNNVQVQVPFRLFYLWWILAIPPCLCIVSLLGMSFEARSVVYEIRNGMYRPLTYALATSLVQAPMLLLLSFFINVCSFAVGGWPWHNFITFVLMYTANLFVFESLAQLLVVLFSNPILGMLSFLMFWTSNILFCGLVFRGEDVIWPFRVLYYILPMRWLFNGAGYDVYSPTKFDGAMECVAGENVTTNQGVATCPIKGFFCTDASQSLGCYGYTGSQVLDTLHYSYESLESNDDRPMDAALMVGMAVLMKAAFAFFLWRKVRQYDAPKDVDAQLSGAKSTLSAVSAN